MLKLSETHLGLLTLLGGIAILVSARDFTPLPNQAYGAGTMPRLVGVCAVLLGLVMVATRFAHWRADAAVHLAPWVRAPGGIVAFASVIAAVLFYILFSESLGFLPTAIPAILVVMLILRAPPLIAVVISVATALVVEWAFGRLLLVPLPRTEFLPFLYS